MSEPLYTERLLLRPLSLDDAEDLFSIYRHSGAMHFMPSLPHESVQQTRDQIAQELGLNGACAWAITLRGESRAIGCINFLGEAAIPAMGYILHPDYWGRGMVAEAGRVALAYGFERLGYDRVELWIDEDNAASLRVAQKLGFKLRSQLQHKYNHAQVARTMLVFGLMAGVEDLAARFYRLDPVLSVPDVLKTVAYYRDILGFRVNFLYGSPTTYAIVARGDWTNSGAAVHLSQVPAGQTAAPAGSLFIEVGSGIDALFDRYAQNGVTVISPPASKPWGLREFEISDCNGQVLRFTTQA